MPRYSKFTKEEIASWPEGHKRCNGCQEVKSLELFNRNKNALLERDTKCKECRKPFSKAFYDSKSHEEIMWRRAKDRASRSGVEFNIDIEDIVIPEFCPVFGLRLQVGLNEKKYHSHPQSPSLDRIDPTKGYVKGNVQVISNRANLLKNNASAWELRQVADFLESNPASNRILVSPMQVDIS
ncbi:HNH endonuclease [Streptomyces phage Wipeout]|nr:HNH endonuclease [Streptomyces phage Wipeout]